MAPAAMMALPYPPLPSQLSYMAALHALGYCQRLFSIQDVCWPHPTDSFEQILDLMTVMVLE